MDRENATTSCKRCPRWKTNGLLCHSCTGAYQRFVAKYLLKDNLASIQRFLREQPYKKKEVKKVKAIVLSPEKFQHTLLAPGFLICSPISAALAKKVTKIAREKHHVLIRGDTGTGKEGVARALHDLSPRADKPFVVVNCAGLTDDLADSELFGHCRNSFTNAGQGSIGLFDKANGGTLFLDEFESLSRKIQAKVLRALQNGEVRRIGAKEPHFVDVRVIAATKVSPEKLTEDGEIRADLYHRFLFKLFLVPLCQRVEEIPILVRYCLEQLERESVVIANGAMELLMRYEWPGNVRELMNVITEALCMRDHDSEHILEIHLPGNIRTHRESGRPSLHAV